MTERNVMLRTFAVSLYATVLVTAGALAQDPQNAASFENETFENETFEDKTFEDKMFEDKMTVTATGSDMLVDELPLAVSVVTREEIDNSMEESVVDLVRRLPGVTVVLSGGEGGAGSFFLRGTESDHVLALFDGVRLSSPYFAGYDFSALSSAGIERVEVVRGPFSALWGSDAIGGVINVVPQRGGDGGRARLFGEVGEDDWLRLEGTFGWSNASADFFVSGYEREGGGDLVNDDFANRQWLLNGGYGWQNGSRLSVLYQNLDAELGVPFSTPGSFTPSRRNDSQQELIAVPMTFGISSTWNLELTPSMVERELAFRDPDDPSGFTSSDTFADTTQIRLASHHAFADNAHALSWGGEWREDEVDASSSFGIDLDGQESDLLGVFVQDVWRASDRLSVILGLRYDDTDEWGSETSPKVSLGYALSDKAQLRASVGQAFRQPALGELYFPFSGNPLLEPEQSESAELGLTLRPGANHRIEVAAFATDTDDLIDFDFVTFAFSNIESTKLRGAEASWSAPIRNGILSTLTANYLDTEDQDGLSLLRRPEWSGSWSLNARIGERLRADLSVFYMGGRADVDASTFARKDVGGFVTGDLGVSYRLLDSLEITARVTNVADREYQAVDGYPAPGRRIMGGLRLSM